MMFILIACSIMFIIALCSWLLSKEFFSVNNIKIARRKMLIINIVMAIAFIFLYPPSNLPIEYAGILGQLMILWFVLQLFLIVLGVLIKVFRLLYEKSCHCKIDESRRRFLRGIIWVPTVSGVIYGGLYERRHIEFDDVDIDVSNAPHLNGLKIAQLSDVHLGSFFSLSQLQMVLNQIVQKAPDILVMTGDIFDSVELNDKAIALINEYTRYFPFGVYFCWGNHEYLRNIEHLKESLDKTNIKVLNNSYIKILSGAKPLYILGVDYLGGENDSKTALQREEYISQALSDVPENAYKILLAHHSIFIDNGFEHNIDLTLTGHTHGGQFAVLGIPLFPIFKYMSGRIEKNGCIGYVNRGAGSWFPYRIGCPPEVTVFNFTAKG